MCEARHTIREAGGKRWIDGVETTAPAPARTYKHVSMFIYVPCTYSSNRSNNSHFNLLNLGLNWNRIVEGITLYFKLHSWYGKLRQ